MRRPLPSLLPIAVLLVLVTGVNAAGAGRIEGRLTLPDGHGIPGVTVTATPASVSTITGADGQLVLDEIPDGEQTVVFALADFAESVTVVVAGGPGGRSNSGLGAALHGHRDGDRRGTPARTPRRGAVIGQRRAGGSHRA